MVRMLVEREDVHRFIPQRQPIVVVHGLVSHAEKTSTSEFTVESDHLFVKGGKLLESGLMEHIAQTAALSSGYGFSLMAAGGKATEPPIGFIAALKDFTIHRLPTVGDVLRTTVTTLHDIMGMQVVEGSVKVEGELIAACEMKIFLTVENQ